MIYNPTNDMLRPPASRRSGFRTDRWPCSGVPRIVLPDRNYAWPQASRCLWDA